MSTKLVVVTGAYGAIGRAIVEGIAGLPGYSVVLVGRSAGKLERAVTQVRHATGNERVRGEMADLSSRSSIQALAARIEQPLAVLVNNAATTPLRREETAEGLEVQFATNVMGYFWMMAAFESHLRAADEARVVNVASYWAGDLDLDDLQFVRRRYDNNAAYRQSKAADRMLSVAFADRFRRAGIAVNACHPGDVNSKLSNSLGFGGHESPETGAETPVLLATTPLGIEHTGRYFEHGRPTECRFGRDAASVTRLVRLCESFA